MNKQLRCCKCNKLLGIGIYTMLEIKCPRCGYLNNLRATEHPTIESHRAQNKKGAYYGHQHTTG